MRRTVLLNLFFALRISAPAETCLPILVEGSEYYYCTPRRRAALRVGGSESTTHSAARASSAQTPPAAAPQAVHSCQNLESVLRSTGDILSDCRGGNAALANLANKAAPLRCLHTLCSRPQFAVPCEAF
eukprot:6198777-Pleurochrysis_carterae.AAC.2